MQRFFFTLYDRLTSGGIDTLSIGVGVVLAPFVVLFERYVFNDWHFAGLLAVVVAIDTVLGVYKAYRLNQVSSKGFGRLISKLLIYFALLVCVHAATHIRANGREVTYLDWLDGVVYAAVLVREFLSILEKAGALGVAVPAWLLKRLRDFDENGKFNNN